MTVPLDVSYFSSTVLGHLVVSLNALILNHFLWKLTYMGTFVSYGTTLQNKIYELNKDATL